MPSIAGLAATGGLTTAKNKKPNVSNLVRKTDYDAKISGIEPLLRLVITHLLVQYLM